jgi:hypothetical protein
MLTGVADRFAAGTIFTNVSTLGSVVPVLNKNPVNGRTGRFIKNGVVTLAGAWKPTNPVGADVGVP